MNADLIGKLADQIISGSRPNTGCCIPLCIYDEDDVNALHHHDAEVRLDAKRRMEKAALEFVCNWLETDPEGQQLVSDEEERNAEEADEKREAA